MTQSILGQVLAIPCQDIHPNPHQPRQLFDPQPLEELCNSITRFGVLQPLTVRKGQPGWELIAGERRLRAAMLAGLESVPCLVTQASDQESALQAMVENIQRQNLHYLEEASALSVILQTSDLTQEELARTLGKSPSAIANKLRLLRLGKDCASFLLAHQLSERHARALLLLESESGRMEVLHHVVAHQLNVAQTERYIHNILAQIQTTPPQRPSSYIVKDVRLFLNSVERNVTLMRTSGVDAHMGREDTEEAIYLTIRIPKGKSQP